MEKKNDKILLNEFIKADDDIQEVSKKDENGDEEKEILYKGKPFFPKIIEKTESIKYNKKLKSSNIIKIYKISEINYNKKFYNIIIMEKALTNLTKLYDDLHNNKIFNLINQPFFEIVGNNLMKYMTKDIVKGLETLDRNELVHYNLKTENLLITCGLKTKIADSSFLIDLIDYIKKDAKLKIPKETRGYITPEYFNGIENKEENRPEYNVENIKKQDYFALGASLFLFKMGSQKLYKKQKDKEISEDSLLDFLQRDISQIESSHLFNDKFVDFICNLMKYTPKERPNLEEIFRNEWLNENFNDIFPISYAYLNGDEDKFIKELVKSDFILEKQKKNKEKQKNIQRFIFDE